MDNAQKQQTLSQDAQDVLGSLSDALIATTDTNNISIDDTEAHSLTLASDQDLGTLSIRISGSGDNCPVVNGRNLCNGTYSLQDNLKTTPHIMPLTVASKKIGTSLISVKICQSVHCIEKDIILTILPGTLTQVDITTPTDKAIYGSELPVVVHGSDAY